MTSRRKTKRAWFRTACDFIERTLSEVGTTFEELTSREKELLDAAMVVHIRDCRVEVGRDRPPLSGRSP